MNGAILYVAFGVFVLALAAVLLWPRRTRSGVAAREGEIPDLSHEDLAPRHAQYFSLVRQALSGSDLAELGKRIPSRTRRRIRAERRKVARHYLAGLREDFVRLERFGRMVASLSPKLETRQETERLRLSLRFRLAYSLISIRLALGQTPVPAFERLTQLVGSLSSRLEVSMTKLVEPGPTQASAG